MIIQKVIKGISNLTEADADEILEQGILCNLWRTIGGPPSRVDSKKRLTEADLDWHQNHFDAPDPIHPGSKFKEHTPFISTTAGCIERDSFILNNQQHKAWFEALRFATNFWTSDGYLFYCHLFVLGKKSIGYEQFSEELRELNVYQDYSHYHPEGEVTAKIVIPSVQIEKWEHYRLADLVGQPSTFHPGKKASERVNSAYLASTEINNIRELI